MATNNVIGLDLSLNSTGYYVSGQDEEFGGLIKPGKRRGPERLAFIMLSLQSVLSAAGDIQLAVIEGYEMGRRKQRQQGKFDGAELGGCVRLHMYREGIPMLIVPPKTLKVFAVDNGNADKDAMVAAANDLGYTPHSDDDADAFFLYRMGCAYLSGRIRCARHRRAMAGSLYVPANNICN